MITGIFANLPFGLASGVGLSIYLTYGLVVSGMSTLSQSMTSCFIAGAILGLCTLSGNGTLAEYNEESYHIFFIVVIEVNLHNFYLQEQLI